MLKQLLASAAIIAAGSPTHSGGSPARTPVANPPPAMASERPTPVGDRLGGRARPEVGELAIRIVVDVPGFGGDGVTTRLRIGAMDVVSVQTLPTFDLRVPAGRANEMVSLDIRGVGGGSRYGTIIGTRGLLSRIAGPDRVVEVGELDRVRVSTLSTALKVELQRVLEGRMPASDLEHEDAVRGASGDVFLGGAFLRRVQSGALALPKGHDDAMALFEDPVAFRAFLRANPSAVPPADIEAFARLPTGIAFPPSDLARSTALLPTRIPGELQLRSTGAGLLFRDGDGFDLHFGDFSGTDAGAAVSAGDDDALLILPTGEPRMHLNSSVTTPSGVQVSAARYTLTRMTARRVFLGERHELWSITTDIRQTFPAFGEVPPSVSSVTSLMHTTSLDDGHSARWRNMTGRYAVPRFCRGPDAAGLPHTSNCEYVDTTLETGGTGLRRDMGPKITTQFTPSPGPHEEMPITWSIDTAGALRIGDEVGDALYWRLDRDDRGADSMLYLARTGPANASTFKVGQTAMMRIDAVDQVLDAPGTLVGTWEFGSFQQSDRGRASIIPRVNRFARRDDGIVLQTFMNLEGPPGTTVLRSGWEFLTDVVDGERVGRLYDTRYIANNLRRYASCAEAFADGAGLCMPETVRYLRPLRLLGTRMYGIEEIYTNTAGFNQTPVMVRTSRPGFHERIQE